MATESRDTPVHVLPAPALSALLLSSYSRVVGQPLAPAALDGAQAARWLYEDAPFCVLAHNTKADPIFIYANKAAQRCFEYSWAEFITLPSRLSAEAPNRAERQMLLNQVTENGFASNYTGVRISGSGRRFFIENATVWQLLDNDGVLQGQGAMLPRWRDVVANQADGQ
jgi:MEKHLA domain